MPLSAVGELTCGNVGPEQNNKWHGRAIGLTPSRLVVVAWSGRSSASGGGEAEVACPWSSEIRQGSRRWNQCAAMGAT
jgi:hypothetical protein